MSLAAAVSSSLHVVELAVRNAIYDGSRKIIDESKIRFEDISCWLDAVPTMLMPAEKLAVAKAKERLAKLKVDLTPDRLVANLSFDFWASLCNSRYEQARRDGPKLWPGLERVAFSGAPKHLRNRADITRRVADVKQLRNHVAHHSRLYHPDFDLLGRLAEALDLLSWINRHVHGVVATLDGTSAIYAAGPIPYRTVAESILKAA